MADTTNIEHLQATLQARALYETRVQALRRLLAEFGSPAQTDALYYHGLLQLALDVLTAALAEEDTKKSGPSQQTSEGVATIDTNT